MSNFVIPDLSAFDKENTMTENEKNTSNKIIDIKSNINEDGIQVYILEKDTYLYHANNRLHHELSKINGPISNINDKFNTIFDVNKSQTSYLVQPLYFSNSLSNIEEYGCRFEFKTIKELKLLAVDALTLSSPFYKDAPVHIQTILRENYGVVDSLTERRIRNSVKHKDDTFVKYLCDNFKETFDGYMTKQMQLVEENSSFHPEIVLCDVKKCVELTSQMDNDAYCKDKYTSHKWSLDRRDSKQEKKRKSIISHVNSFSSPSFTSPSHSPSRKRFAILSFDSPSRPRIDNSIFSSSMFSSPYSSPTKKHTGGTKRIRNKKHKSNKSKSSKNTRKTRKSNK